MFVLSLTLYLTILEARITIVAGKRTVMFQTAGECTRAIEPEVGKLMNVAQRTSVKMKKTIRATVRGGCTSPTNPRFADKPPESSGG